MSELSAFVHGIVLALGLIVALGPQNIFIFQQGAVQPRFQRVLPSIVTAGIADTVLISLAVGGVSAGVLRLEWLRALLFGAGVLFLLYLGWEILFGSTFEFDIKSATAFGTRRQVVFTAAVTVLNPGVVIDVIAVIGTNALHYTGIEKWVFAGGCRCFSRDLTHCSSGKGPCVAESNFDCARPSPPLSDQYATPHATPSSSASNPDGSSGWFCMYVLSVSSGYPSKSPQSYGSGRLPSLLGGGRSPFSVAVCSGVGVTVVSSSKAHSPVSEACAVASRSRCSSSRLNSPPV